MQLWFKLENTFEFRNVLWKLFRSTKTRTTFFSCKKYVGFFLLLLLLFFCFSYHYLAYAFAFCSSLACMIHTKVNSCVSRSTADITHIRNHRSCRCDIQCVCCAVFYIKIYGELYFSCNLNNGQKDIIMDKHKLQLKWYTENGLSNNARKK